MSTEFFNDQWRIPSNENQNKVSNYSMKFDGSSTLIDLGSTLGDIGTSTTTFSFWLNIPTSTSHRTVLSNRGSGGGWAIDMFDVSGQYILSFFNASSSTSIRCNFNDFNTWAHIVIVRDGISNNKIYINGVSQTLTSNNENLTNIISSKTLTIGAQDPLGTGYYRFLNGQIDQVTIFDYALPATGTNSVATLYGGGTAVTNSMTLSPKPIYYAQLGDQSVYNGANYLVPNNSLSDYVFNFDGSNDYIDIGNDVTLQFSSSFTISAWVKIDLNDTGNNAIISKDSSLSNGAGYHIDFRNGNSVHAWSYNANSKLTATGLTTNTWYHIVFIFESTGGSNGNQSLYINAGTPVTNTVTNFAASTIKNLRIGGSEVLSNYNNGKISNASIFNTELTSTQVQTIYNNGAPNDISSLSPVAWYKLNAADTFDGSNWTINDYGSGGNDGTSFNMTSANLVVSDLQQTSGYSPYALDFDGIDDRLNCGNDSSLQITGAMTISYWIKGACTNGASGVSTFDSVNSPGYIFGPHSNGLVTFIIADAGSSGSTKKVDSTQQITTTEWHHIVGVYTPSVSMKIYIDGQLSKNETSNIPSSQYTNGNDFIIGYRPCCKIDGQISNVAIWNTDLSFTEVTEIYNESVPGNLHNFSGTTPVSWWQLGSNSSYLEDPNPNPPNVIGRWTCLDEVGTNNAESSNNMTNDAITDGPGYSASGLGTSSIDIKGDAPYSTANGLSENMDVLDRTTDVAPS
jgi:hypothetical protein